MFYFHFRFFIIKIHSKQWASKIPNSKGVAETKTVIGKCALAELQPSRSHTYSMASGAGNWSSITHPRMYFQCCPTIKQNIYKLPDHFPFRFHPTHNCHPSAIILTHAHLLASPFYISAVFPISDCNRSPKVWIYWMDRRNSDRCLNCSPSI